MSSKFSALPDRPAHVAFQVAQALLPVALSNRAADSP